MFWLSSTLPSMFSLNLNDLRFSDSKGETCPGKGLVALQSLLTLKKDTRTFSFNKTFNYLLSITYGLCPGFWGAVPTLEVLLYDLRDYFEQNGYLKTLIRCICAKDGLEGGDWLPSVHFWLLKRELEVYISNWIRLFPKFVRPHLL